MIVQSTGQLSLVQMGCNVLVRRLEHSGLDKIRFLLFSPRSTAAAASERRLSVLGYAISMSIHGVCRRRVRRLSMHHLCNGHYSWILLVDAVVYYSKQLGLGFEALELSL